MKKLTLNLFLALVWSVGFAQKPQPFKIDSLPKQGILLDKNWKWHAGDNPDFAKADFDDSKWESIDPTKDVMDLPQIFDSKIKWLRLDFVVKSKLPNPLGLSINQVGASEIYLNGRLVKQIGHFDVDLSKVVASDPRNIPIYLSIDSIGKFSLAIKYILQPNIHYSKLYSKTTNFFFKAKVVDLVPTQNKLLSYEIYDVGRDLLKVGIFLILFILHFAFYLNQKNNKGHLLLASIFLCFFIQYILKIVGEDIANVPDRFLYLNASWFFNSPAVCIELAALYYFAKIKIDFFYWALLGFAFIINLLAIFTYNHGLPGFLLFSFVAFVLIIRITIIGIRKKIRGFSWLSVAVILNVMAYIFITITVFQIFKISPYLIDLFFNVGVLAFPIGLSIFMGLEASHTNKELTEKLTENEILKEHAVKQEKEKQQILATQNETLEKQVHERTAELVHKNRDLEIEAALERVRSRSMAMHKSDELHEVIKVLFEQLINLNFKIDSAQFDLNYKESDAFDFWTAIPSQPYPFKLHIPYFDHPFLNQKRVAKENGLDFSIANYTFEEKNLYFQHLFKYNPLIPEERKKYILNCPGMAVSAVLLKTISLWAGNYNGTPFSDDENVVLRRFALVFEQSYTRFLDLQKAEAHSEQAHRDLILIQTEKKRAEDALTILKSTQAQLIQSEKLASLGELTAGIAHEIQNPLNFVNNFSEMSVELAKELKEEVEKSEMDKALIIDLANDLSENQEKITHHGKRASSIVKGMLEHSRTSTGTKELTDINKMADEFLRLAYHGLRAKDNSFNSNFKTDFDKNLPRINVVSQDIGRVLLNLISNAFYAVGKREKEGKETGESFKPTVNISTKNIDNQVVIKISDNGTGISEATKAKIFQPFFTTKPTGEGTGLGLSLSYDIVKTHGGTLECESVENEGTTFVIKLPFS